MDGRKIVIKLFGPFFVLLSRFVGLSFSQQELFELYSGSLLSRSLFDLLRQIMSDLLSSAECARVILAPLLSRDYDEDLISLEDRKLLHGFSGLEESIADGLKILRDLVVDPDVLAEGARLLASAPPSVRMKGHSS